MTGEGLTREERKERQHQAVRQEIRAAAWVQIGRTGASSLSLRSLAASLGLSPAALYRYYPGKNSLVTALILEAYESLTASQDRVLEENPEGPWEILLEKLGLAYRDWALENTQAFQLIFGSPVAGYEIPFEETMPVAGRSLNALIRVIESAHREGALDFPLDPPAAPGLAASLEAWTRAIYRTLPEVLYLAYVVSTRVQGMMTVELGGQLPPFFPDGSELYRREIQRTVAELKKKAVR